MDDTIKNFFSGDILICFPRKTASKRMVLEKIVENFEVDKKYTEKEVNEILKKVYSDFILIRRSLIESYMLKRTDDGRQYWREKGSKV